MKLCFRCNELKDFSEFHKNSARSDGLQVNCKVCRKVIDSESYKKSESRQLSIKDRRDRIREYNRTLMRRYKAFCGCKFCDESEPVALDLHHLDPNEKDLNPSSAIGFSTTSMKKEIRKCIVLCANCHRKVHAGILEL